MPTSLYPEIDEFGSLARFLRHSLGAPGLAISGFDETIKGSRFWAGIKTTGRSSDVCTALEERLFIAPLWHLGVQLATCSTSSTEELRKVLRAWFIDELPATQLPPLSRTVAVNSLAADYEAGAEAFVGAVWQAMLNSYDGRFRELLSAASHTPQLRALLPFVSMTTLCFSRTTGFPYLTDAPRIACEADGSFTVRAQSGGPVQVQSAQEASAVAAAALGGEYKARHGTAAG